MAAIRILIVDDITDVRRDLRTLLPLAGDIEVVGEAAEGLEAVRLAEALQPEAVLMDLQMPVLDGYEATRRIKTRCPSCRVIALTVHYDEAAWQRAIQAGVEILQGFAESWMMPVIFLISGASIFFAMGIGGSGKYFKDKLLRSGVPLLVGVFTHASLQVYLERRAHNQFFGSYFEFLPQYFNGIYLDVGSHGNFAFAGMHLWYLLVLLVYALAFYPLFYWLKGHGKVVLSKLGDFLAMPGVVYLLAVPTFLFLDYIESTPLGDIGPGGWPLPAYIPFLLAGFVLVSHQCLQARIQQLRWVSLAIGLAFSAMYLYLDIRSTLPKYAGLLDDLDGPLYCLMSWGWILAFTGFASLHLNYTTPSLRYSNEAVLPFYILHQTVLLSVGYFVVQWQIPDLLKWLVITVISFTIIMWLYEYLVRRNNLLRFLFGMKALARPSAVTTREAILTSENTR